MKIYYSILASAWITGNVVYAICLVGEKVEPHTIASSLPLTIFGFLAITFTLGFFVGSEMKGEE